MHNKTPFSLYLLVVTLTILLTSCGNKPEKVILKNQQDTLSWAMGMSLAHTSKSGFYQFNEDLIKQAFENTINNGKQPIDDQTYQSAREYINFLVAKFQHDQSKSAAQRGDSLQQQAFARLTVQNPNLKHSDKGYYYEVLREGKGPKAQIGLRVKFDFKGTDMLTGNVIEQTFGVREPIIHVLNHPMFEGLLDGMQLRNAGSRYRFYFPYQLVTNANGIPPYTPVVYEVELYEIYKD